MAAMEKSTLVKEGNRPKKKTRTAEGRKSATRRKSFSGDKKPNMADTAPTVSPRKGKNNKHDKELEELFEQVFDPEFLKERKESLRRFMMCSVFLDIGYLDKARQSQEIFLKIFREHCHTSPPELIKLAEKLCSKKRFIESVLMFEIAVDLLNIKEENHDNIALFTMECLQQLEGLTKVMVECTPGRRPFVKDYVVPFMRVTLEKFRGLVNVNPEIRFSRYVCSCIFVGYTEWNIEDFDGAEASWLRAIGACREFYGENANRHCILGTCYQNMGNFYATSGRPAEAEGYLKLAMEVFIEAEEYESDEERQNDVKTCVNLLNKLKT